MEGLGDALREAREHHDITLDEAEAATKVRKPFLAALEAERFDLLPARVYTQGFVQLYARYLNLDAQPLLALLPSEPGTEQEAEGYGAESGLPGWLIVAVVMVGLSILLTVCTLSVPIPIQTG